MYDYPCSVLEAEDGGTGLVISFLHYNSSPLQNESGNCCKIIHHIHLFPSPFPYFSNINYGLVMGARKRKSGGIAVLDGAFASSSSHSRDGSYW